MTKYLGYILAAVIALLALGVLWRAKTNEAAWSNERSQFMLSADSAKQAFAAHAFSMDSLVKIADKHQHRADSLEQLKTPLLPRALQRNRWAGVEEIGEGLTRKLP